MEYQLIEYRGTEGLYQDYVEAGEVPLMGGFNLEFSNSDHKLDSLIVGDTTGSDPSGTNYRSYLLQLTDGDAGTPVGGGDSVNLWAKVLNVNPGLTYSVSASGDASGQAVVPVSPVDEDHIFVLRGFAIRTPIGDSNHNLRRLAIRHDRDLNTVTCIFRDDSPNDDDFSFILRYSIVLNRTRRPAEAEQYFTGPYEVSSDFVETTEVSKPVAGISVLSGFDFQFKDSDHHLRQICIDPVSKEKFKLTFTDDERDNPVSAWVEYAILDESTIGLFY